MYTMGRSRNGIVLLHKVSSIRVPKQTLNRIVNLENFITKSIKEFSDTSSDRH